ncbi:hypothetical protein A2125_00570 [Candidatus Woesebacteria bacterium GWB1_43_5]|uniref:BrnT family toxin n=1 Tax=Candidatus Woesebacteria bacterium GWB1_43_5 TaxID=1802474 RepID=A0A1F7WTK1_9BACT|nr:MAG: hypothetical protein A2125_00570 [Candidatus Woesebacteria bacterium GWB1_43_5]
MDIISEPLEFEWDKGNINKSLKKHGVTNEESEEVFLNENLLVHEDKEHSTKEEKRYFCLGATDSKKKLFMSFTIRKNKVRIISSRPLSKNERRIYEQTIKTITKI